MPESSYSAQTARLPTKSVHPGVQPPAKVLPPNKKRKVSTYTHPAQCHMDALDQEWYFGAGAKAQAALDAAEFPGQQHFVIQRDAPVSADPRDHTKAFAAFRDVGAFLRLHERYSEAKRSFYLCYSESDPCRLTVDYELYIKGLPTGSSPHEPTDAEAGQAAAHWASFRTHLQWVVEEVTGKAWDELPGIEIVADSSRRKPVSGHTEAGVDTLFWRPSLHVTHTGLIFSGGMRSQLKLWALALWHADRECDPCLRYRKPSGGGQWTEDTVMDMAIYKGDRVMRLLGSRKELKPGTAARLVCDPPLPPDAPPHGHAVILAATLTPVGYAFPADAEQRAAYDAELPRPYNVAHLFPKAPLHIDDAALDAALVRHGVGPHGGRADSTKRRRKTAPLATSSSAAASSSSSSSDHIAAASSNDNGRRLYTCAAPLDHHSATNLQESLPSEWASMWGGTRRSGRNRHGEMIFFAQSTFCIFRGGPHSSPGNYNFGRWSNDGTKLYVKCMKAGCAAAATNALLSRAAEVAPDVIDCSAATAGGLRLTFATPRRSIMHSSAQREPEDVLPVALSSHNDQSTLSGEDEPMAQVPVDPAPAPPSALTAHDDQNTAVVVDDDDDDDDDEEMTDEGEDCVDAHPEPRGSPWDSGTEPSRLLDNAFVHPATTKFVKPVAFGKPEQRAIVISASMGMGKSTVMRRFVKRRPGQRFLLISARRQQSQTAMGLMSALSVPAKALVRGEDFKHYEDAGVDLATCPRLVIQYESLHRLCSQDRMCTEFDYIIIDEWRSVTGQATSPFNAQHTRANFEIYTDYLRSTRCILLDADIECDSMCAMMCHYLWPLPGQVLFHRYLAVKLRRKFTVLTDDVWHRELEADVRAGKRVAVIFRSKKRMDTLLSADFIDPTQTLFFSGDSTTAEERMFRDIDLHLEGKRLLMYTSKVTVGADVLTRFDRIYLDCKGGRGPSAREVFQMTGRIRDVTDQHIKTLLPPARAEAPSPTPFLDQWRIVKQRQLHGDIGILLRNASPRVIEQIQCDFKVDHRLWTPGFLLTLVAHMLVEREECFTRRFRELAAIKGLPVLTPAPPAEPDLAVLGQVAIRSDTFDRNDREQMLALATSVVQRFDGDRCALDKHVQGLRQKAKLGLLDALAKSELQLSTTLTRYPVVVQGQPADEANAQVDERKEEEPRQASPDVAVCIKPEFWAGPEPPTLTPERLIKAHKLQSKIYRARWYLIDHDDRATYFDVKRLTRPGVFPELIAKTGRSVAVFRSLCQLVGLQPPTSTGEIRNTTTIASLEIHADRIIKTVAMDAKVNVSGRFHDRSKTPIPHAERALRALRFLAGTFGLRIASDGSDAGLDREVGLEFDADIHSLASRMRMRDKIEPLAGLRSAVNVSRADHEGEAIFQLVEHTFV